MLFEFIAAHRQELIALTSAMGRRRSAPEPAEDQLTSGVALLLDHLIEASQRSLSSTVGAFESGATAHAAELWRRGYTVAEVLREYRDVYQAVADLAIRGDAGLGAAELLVLNLRLDDAAAEAVTEYTRRRDSTIAAGEAERSGVFTHELRNKIAATQLGFQAIESGRSPVRGSVAARVAQNLRGMTWLIERANLSVRLDSGITRPERVHLDELLRDAEVDGTMAAAARGVSLTVTPVDRGVDVAADPQVLVVAVSNLLQNALKFTHVGGHVLLRAIVIGARVEIDVEDECGGLPPGKADELFGAFQQRSADRSGLGLGLFVSRKGVEASGGVLRVRDRPGTGCVFTIDLPLMMAS